MKEESFGTEQGVLEEDVNRVGCVFYSQEYKPRPEALGLPQPATGGKQIEARVRRMFQIS